MQKHVIIYVSVAIILIIAGIFLYENYFNEGNVVQVGEISFILPNEYHEGGLNKYNHQTITDGSHSIFLTYYNGTNITDYINEYKVDRERNNRSISISDFTINNHTIYKSDSNAGANHYWFVDNNKIYQVYTWEEIPNIDNIVFDMISSAKFS